MKLHKEVKRKLKAVARGKYTHYWPGFDDADIKWFLEKHKDKSGPTLDWLRAEYQEMLDVWESPKYANSLFFFPVTPEQAEQLLKEISQ